MEEDETGSERQVMSPKTKTRKGSAEVNDSRGPKRDLRTIAAKGFAAQTRSEKRKAANPGLGARESKGLQTEFAAVARSGRNLQSKTADRNLTGERKETAQGQKPADGGKGGSQSVAGDLRNVAFKS